MNDVFAGFRYSPPRAPAAHPVTHEKLEAVIVAGLSRVRCRARREPGHKAAGRRTLESPATINCRLHLRWYFRNSAKNAPLNRRLCRRAFCFLIITLGFQLGGKAENADQVVQLLEGKYQSLKSFSATFRQRYENAEQVIEESGVLIIKKPGKMYWEYQKPASKYFLVDGRKSWFYVPADKQVIVTNLQDDASTPLMLLFGKGDLRSDFEVQEEKEQAPRTAGNWLLRLVPRTPQGDFSHIVLEVNPATAIISRLMVVEPIGARNEYVFSDIIENRKVSDKLFKLRLPSDVEVVEQ